MKPNYVEHLAADKGSVAGCITTMCKVWKRSMCVGPDHVSDSGEAAYIGVMGKNDVNIWRVHITLVKL